MIYTLARGERREVYRLDYTAERHADPATRAQVDRMLALHRLPTGLDVGALITVEAGVDGVPMLQVVSGAVTYRQRMLCEPPRDGWWADELIRLVSYG